MSKKPLHPPISEIQNEGLQGNVTEEIFYYEALSADETDSARLDPLGSLADLCDAKSHRPTLLPSKASDIIHMYGGTKDRTASGKGRPLRVVVYKATTTLIKGLMSVTTNCVGDIER